MFYSVDLLAQSLDPRLVASLRDLECIDLCAMFAHEIGKERDQAGHHGYGARDYGTANRGVHRDSICAIVVNPAANEPV